MVDYQVLFLFLKICGAILILDIIYKSFLAVYALRILYDFYKKEIMLSQEE